MAVICHCGEVRDRTIVSVIQCGAHTLADVQAACGAATQCGGCTPAILALLAAHDGPAAGAVRGRQMADSA